MKVCSKCKIKKPPEAFIKNKARKDGLHSYCKVCHKEKNNKHRQENIENYRKQARKQNKKRKDKIKQYHKENWQKILTHKKKWRDNNREKQKELLSRRRAAKLKRTPVWADLEAIKEVYKNCPKGMHVDHIIPLRGKEVSGLHVAENLQYLTPEENLKKSNKLLENERSL